METNPNAIRAALVEQTVDILNLYRDFPSDYTVSFDLTPAANGWLPGIAAHMGRKDGRTFAETGIPLDGKLNKLKDQTAVVRPFFLPRMKVEWDNSDVNDVKDVDFDYAAIIGYGKDGDDYVVKSLYYVPAEAFFFGRKPDEDGVWRKIPLATFNVSQLSLDPRKKFAKFLYLAERMVEGLEYQIDQFGYFNSNP